MPPADGDARSLQASAAPWLRLGLAGLVLFAFAWASHTGNVALATWDESTLAWTAASPELVVEASLLLQWLGRGLHALAAALALGLALALRGRRWEAVTVIGVVVAGNASAGLLKQLVGRTRPETALAFTSDYAFPSGHATLGAVVAVLFAWMLLPRTRTRGERAVVVLVATLWALAMATSRVVLHVHYFTDVVGGLGLGAAVAGLGIASMAFARERLAARAAPAPLRSAEEPSGAIRPER